MTTRHNYHVQLRHNVSESWYDWNCYQILDLAEAEIVAANLRMDYPHGAIRVILRTTQEEVVDA